MFKKLEAHWCRAVELAPEVMTTTKERRLKRAKEHGRKPGIDGQCGVLQQKEQGRGILENWGK